MGKKELNFKIKTLEKEISALKSSLKQGPKQRDLKRIELSEKEKHFCKDRGKNSRRQFLDLAKDEERKLHDGQFFVIGIFLAVFSSYVVSYIYDRSSVWVQDILFMIFSIVLIIVVFLLFYLLMEHNRYFNSYRSGAHVDWGAAMEEGIKTQKWKIEKMSELSRKYSNATSAYQEKAKIFVKEKT